jgi:alpha-galactosidase
MGVEEEVNLRSVDLGLSDREPATIKDLWSGKDLGSLTGSWSSRVPAGDAILLLIKGTDLPSTAYKPEKPEENRSPCRGCEVTFTRVAARGPWSRIRITYRNSGDGPRYAELRINGQGPTSVAFPAVGAGAGEISILGRLDRPGDANVLTFSSTGDLTALIDTINVE